MANRTSTQTVDRITELRINDRINVRSLETGREDTFIVEEFEFTVIEGRPEITVQLRTPHDEPGAIILFNTPGGLCLSPTDVPQRQTIEAEVSLYEGHES